MNTLLKILGLILLAVIALKLAPLVLLPLVLFVALVLAVGAVLAGGAAVACVVVLTLSAVLAPIWIPVALLVGFVALICRMARRSPSAI